MIFGGLSVAFSQYEKINRIDSITRGYKPFFICFLIKFIQYNNYENGKQMGHHRREIDQILCV